MKDQWLQAAKQALIQVSTAEDARGHLDQMSQEELVIFGQRLWWMTKRAKKLLDVIKVHFREKAHHSQARFAAPDGSHCLVIPHAAGLELRKGTDIEALKKQLGERFDLFFEEVVQYTPRKDFRSRVAACVPTEQKVLMDVLEMSDRTARVVFKD